MAVAGCVCCRAPVDHCCSLIASCISGLAVLNPYGVCLASCSIHFHEACSGWHTSLHPLIPFKSIRASHLWLRWLRSWVGCGTAFSLISCSTSLLEDQVISFTGLLIFAFSFRSFFSAFVVVSFLTESQWGATYLKYISSSWEWIKQVWARKGVSLWTQCRLECGCSCLSQD